MHITSKLFAINLTLAHTSKLASFGGVNIWVDPIDDVSPSSIIHSVLRNLLVDGDFMWVILGGIYASEHENCAPQNYHFLDFSGPFYNGRELKVAKGGFGFIRH